jgi:hypothetical protein
MAARNNAEWCDTVCRTHGVHGVFHKDAWISPQRTPALYPDAITLDANVSESRLVKAIDTIAPGCSIKDSFATLALGPYGFHILFDAEWIFRAARTSRRSAKSNLRWSRIQTVQALDLWETAWSEGGSPRGLFRPELLQNDDVAVLGAFNGDCLVAGAMIYRSSSVVGISNVFTTSEDLDHVWESCLTAVSAYFPNQPVVGYESGDGLHMARACGFEPIGALRVWICDR